jgi:hypothetical protein
MATQQRTDLENEFIMNFALSDLHEEPRFIWRAKRVLKRGGEASKNGSQCAIELFLKNYTHPSRPELSVSEGRLVADCKVWLSAPPSRVGSLFHVDLTDFTFIARDHSPEAHIEKRGLQKLFFNVLPVLYQSKQIRVSSNFEYEDGVTGTDAIREFAERFQIGMQADDLELIVHSP